MRPVLRSMAASCMLLYLALWTEHVHTYPRVLALFRKAKSPSIGRTCNPLLTLMCVTSRGSKNIPRSRKHLTFVSSSRNRSFPFCSSNISPVARRGLRCWRVRPCALWLCSGCSGTPSPAPTSGGRSRRCDTCPWYASGLKEIS